MREGYKRLIVYWGRTIHTVRLDFGDLRPFAYDDGNYGRDLVARSQLGFYQNFVLFRGNRMPDHDVRLGARNKPESRISNSGRVIGSFSAIRQRGHGQKINIKLPAIYQVADGLFLAVPVYLLSWFFIEQANPGHRAVARCGVDVYLGAIATTVGFALYFFVLTHLPATNVALITLITPVLSLLLCHLDNMELISSKVIAGAGLIILALVFHQLGRR